MLFKGSHLGWATSTCRRLCIQHYLIFNVRGDSENLTAHGAKRTGCLTECLVVHRDISSHATISYLVCKAQDRLDAHVSWSAGWDQTVWGPHSNYWAESVLGTQRVNDNFTSSTYVSDTWITFTLLLTTLGNRICICIRALYSGIWIGFHLLVISHTWQVDCKWPAL